MSTVIGILVDVSGSMKQNAIGEVEGEGGEWVRSIFTVIDDLVKHDISRDNHVFAIAVGASCGSGIFDVLGTIDQVQTETSHDNENLRYSEIVEKTFSILEKNGAHSIRKWAQEDVIQDAVSFDMALLILNKLESDETFVTNFVHNCLPRICRDIPKVARAGGAGIAGIASAFLVPFPFNIPVIAAASAAAYHGQTVFDTAMTDAGNKATKEDIMEVVQKAKGFFLKNVDDRSVITVQKASDIVHGYVDGRELTTDRVNKLMEVVEPFIYGRTPLFESLTVTKNIFLKQKYNPNNKLLFVLSDGYPTDTGDLDDIVKGLRDSEVSVVSCYISKSRQVEPKRLYSSPQYSWDTQANFLFRLSSTITTQLLPRAIFIKRGWEIDITNNETKLFIHVNHPDILKDACDLARNIVCSQDALSDLLMSVSLDIYINQSAAGFRAQEQVGGTCYANASAAVLHLAMKRILGREGGYPDFNTLRQELIARYGEQGAVTLQVLQEICPRYRLHCEQVDLIGAMRAITAKRPVVARFRLTDQEWEIFSSFFQNNPKGILTNRELNINKPNRENLQGHAVVLTSYNSECLRLMNSWGNKWADMGFFRVENASILDLKFIDVFWTLKDLTNGEKEYYRQHGPDVLANLIRVLKGLQTEEYKCPKCKRKSLVTDFSGTLLEAECPKCHNLFECDDPGNILAINMYLLSLSK